MIDTHIYRYLQCKYVERKVKKFSEAKSIDSLNDMLANTSFSMSPFVGAIFVPASASVNP